MHVCLAALVVSAFELFIADHKTSDDGKFQNRKIYSSFDNQNKVNN